MIARVLDIPEDAAERATWLDRQIAGADLHEIVAELAAVHGVAPERRSAGVDEVARWLGPRLPEVLAQGTAALDGRRMCELLRTPQLLPGLQELAFIEGGDYWQQLAEQASPAAGLPALDPERFVSRAAHAAAANEGSARGQTTHQRREAATIPGTASAVVGHRRRSTAAAILAALAASLLIGVGVWSWRSSQPAAPWGWNLTDALAAAAPDVYLERLATGAAEWSAVTPATESALAGRLREMLVGCDRLIAAPHEPLAAADREWLVEKCRAWREKLAGHLAALAQSHDVAAVRREADATMEKLTAALRARAEESRQRGDAA